MHLTPSHRYDEPGSSSGSTDMSNMNENRNHPNQGQSSSLTSSQTLYIPIASPPTPAPSPGPVIHQSQGNPFPPLTMMNSQNSQKRRHFLSSVVSSCTPSELLFVSQTINHLLKRDFLYSLPTELSLYILKFIDEPKTLVRAGQVSKHWRSIVRDESVWKRLCLIHGFDDWDLEKDMVSQRNKNRLEKAVPVEEENNINDIDNEGPTSSDRRSKRKKRDSSFSYRRHFRTSYIIRASPNTISFFLSYLHLEFRHQLAKRRNSPPFTSSPCRQPTPWNCHFSCIGFRLGRSWFRGFQD